MSVSIRCGWEAAHHENTLRANTPGVKSWVSTSIGNFAEFENGPVSLYYTREGSLRLAHPPFLVERMQPIYHRAS